MNESELNSLLRRSENETLDFKSKQYPFAGARDEEKSEMLKDVLSMANAWKSSDAYILIGVEEKNERATGLCGADVTLGDSCVQQFVNSKTNRPISFRVEVLPHQGVNLTIIHIDKKQNRPICLVKNFGSLKKGVVYIRHGSSTDEAAPDEIAEMGKEAARVASPEVSLEFEFAMETCEEWRLHDPFPYEPPKKYPDVFLKIYAKNHRGGLAKIIQGFVWIPEQFLIEVMVNRGIRPARTPEEVANGELEKIEVSNKLADAPIHQFAKRPLPDWKPIVSGMRLCIKEVSIHHSCWAMLNKIPGSILWQISADDGDAFERETKFADIPLIDRRHELR